MGISGTGNGMGRVSAAIAVLDSQIVEIKAERDAIREQDPDSHLTIVLEDGLARVQELRTITIIEACFGGVEILEAGEDPDDARDSIATLKDPLAPRSELAHNNMVEDGVPLAHSTLFADADQH